MTLANSLPRSARTPNAARRQRSHAGDHGPGPRRPGCDLAAHPRLVRAGIGWPACQVGRCVGSPICIPGTGKPMHPSSPNSACLSVSMTTSPAKPLASATESATVDQHSPPLANPLAAGAHLAVLKFPSRCGGRTGIRAAGKRKLVSIAVKTAPRMGARMVDDIRSALDAQTVVVSGTSAAELVPPKLVDSLKEVLPATQVHRRRCREDAW